MRKPTGWRLGALIAAPLVLVLVAALLVPRFLPDRPPAGQRWVAASGTVGRIFRLDPRVARLYFDRSDAIVLNEGWKGATRGAAWASLEAFLADVEAGRIPEDVEAVMYDPERWPATPPAEQRNPIAAMRAFGAVARAQGYEQVIVTPHQNLMRVADAVCRAEDDETNVEAFLRCGIPYTAAEAADVVEIQAQELQERPAAYAAFVEAAAVQARTADPDAIVLAGLSTRFSTNAHGMLRAWDAVVDVVDGHYLAMPHGIRPWIATRFLSLLAERYA
jgi:hypothetical protein